MCVCVCVSVGLCVWLCEWLCVLLGERKEIEGRETER